MMIERDPGFEEIYADGGLYDTEGKEAELGRREGGRR